MRMQLAGEEADRIEARRPQFSVEPGYVSREDVNVPRGELTIRQDSGVALSNVTVTASGDYVLGLRGERVYDEYGDQDFARVASVELGSMSSGTTATLHIDLEYEHVTPIRIELELECAAREGGHTWTEHLVTTLNRRPEPPRALGPRERRRLGRTD